MSQSDGIRWNVRKNPQPRGFLSNVVPLEMSEREFRARAASRHVTTELNPAGIYAPPGDPLHRPDLAAPVENLATRRLVIGTCLWLGCWGLFGFALCYFLGAL